VAEGELAGCEAQQRAASRVRRGGPPEALVPNLRPHGVEGGLKRRRQGGDLSTQPGRPGRDGLGVAVGELGIAHLGEAA